MTTTPSPARLASVTDLDSLLDYLHEDLDWPTQNASLDDLTFSYTPEELGLRDEYTVGLRRGLQLRPLTTNQPWGIFFLDFDKTRLPVVALRRILRKLVSTHQANPDQPTWKKDDLIFVANTGESDHRALTFAHFHDNGQDPPTLHAFTWDDRETEWHAVNRDLNRLHWPDNPNDATRWRDAWSAAFSTPHRYTITTAQDLSSHLARAAQRTRRMIAALLKVEGPTGALHKLFGSFKKALIHDLDAADFADMLAQTLAYGLFSVRATSERKVDLQHLADLPRTNPFLQDLLGELVKLSGDGAGQLDFDEIGATELIELLNDPGLHLDYILDDFGRTAGGGNEDPVIHFYESFLHEYDRALKFQRGVFYTPKPVVSFIVRSVHEILQTEFGLPD
ncbi:MAG TPA: hypothetical protein VHN99_10645, partial [Deinococcales bacterium]|nr:hypothetical protein [Deinococcales bacterium]